MSVKLRFECPADGTMIQRSRSFTGFSTLSGRRRSSSARNSLRTKVLSGKSPRAPPAGRAGSSVWGQQPEQVDRIFQALRKGLKEYLEGHQMELDFLSSQQRDTKRNSRLAFLYDLEKEIRALERHIRRLEFQISKVEELYEAYCIQWRLCQGAMNMKRAFALSPSTRASRDSLLELNRNHRHSLEDMCVMEGELEILLGELQIKMKGLIGFARLCPGDQYEVLIRLGRQRWRIRGRIQADDRQAWDEEEMVFLPHIHENFEIKVTEVKGLGSILVGMVTCKSADFFMSQPQMMVVDITELGTIKLQLQVVWNPFDSGEVRPVMSSASRQSLPSRKGSVYSWTPPNTPSFTEKYFISMMRQLQDGDGSISLGSRASRGVSLFSYLSDSSPALTPPIYERRSHSHITPDTPPEEEDLRQRDKTVDWPMGPQTTSPSPPPSPPPSPHPCPPPSLGSERDMSSLLHRYGTPDILRQNGGALQVQLETDPAGQDPPAEPSPVWPAEGGRDGGVPVRVGSLLGQLDTHLQDMSLAEPELKRLDSTLRQLSDTLKSNMTETLAVEDVLGSFDFLSTDFSVDLEEPPPTGSQRNSGRMGSLRGPALRGLGLLAQELPSAAGGGHHPKGRAREDEQLALSTGHHGLDRTLETHLSICAILLRTARQSDSDLVRKDLLEELSWQTEVLEKICKFSQRRVEDLSATDVLEPGPRSKGILAFWEECTDAEMPFCCSAAVFLSTLRKRFIHKVKARQPGQPYAVFAQLLQQVQAGCRMVPVAVCTADRVTVFQLHVFLCRWSLTDLGEHIARLSKEVYLGLCLESPKRRRALRGLRGRALAELLPLGHTLQLLAHLQTDANHNVCQAATACLCRAAALRPLRAKAAVHYTELLRTGDARLKHSACLALKCLKAAECAEQIAELWRSGDEDLRSAARETVLSFGKKGHVAFQRMDRICSELQEEAYRNQDTETTIL